VRQFALQQCDTADQSDFSGYCGCDSLPQREIFASHRQTLAASGEGK
jgi:hypothetical protein